MNKMNCLRFLSITLPWFGAALVLFWLVEQRLPWSGEKIIDLTWASAQPWMSGFTPNARVRAVHHTGPGQTWSGESVISGPVYSSLRLPALYERLDLSLIWQGVSTSLLEIGYRRPEQVFFTIQPFWSRALSDGWKFVTWQGRTGYVRHGDSPVGLWEDDYDRLLVWHATTTSPVWMDHGAQTQRVKVSLRGLHDIYLVPVDGAISIILSLQDMHRKPSSGRVVFSFNKDDDLLASDAMSFATTQVSGPSAVRDKHFSFNGLTPGVYRLSVAADDDVFIRAIETTAKRWVIGPRLYLGDQVGYAQVAPLPKIWTNARHLQAQTFHVEGLQTLSLGQATCKLVATHTESRLDRLPTELVGSQPFSAPSGDVRIVADGFFAFSQSALFLPRPRRFTAATDPVAEGVRAVLTSYQAPEQLSDGWLVSHTQLSVHGLSNLALSLSVSGDMASSVSLSVRAAKLKFSRPGGTWSAWLNAWRAEARSAYHRVYSSL